MDNIPTEGNTDNFFKELEAIGSPSHAELSYLSDALGTMQNPELTKRLYKQRPCVDKPVVEADILKMMSKLVGELVELIVELETWREAAHAEFRQVEAQRNLAQDGWANSVLEVEQLKRMIGCGRL